MLLKIGRRYKFRAIEFWAEDGRVIMIDQRQNPPTRKEVSRKDFLLLAKARSEERDCCQYPDEKLELQNLIESMIQCCKEVKEQGDQMDRSTWKWRVRSKPLSLMMPSPEEVKSVEKSRTKKEED